MGTVEETIQRLTEVAPEIWNAAVLSEQTEAPFFLLLAFLLGVGAYRSWLFSKETDDELLQALSGVATLVMLFTVVSMLFESVSHWFFPEVEAAYRLLKR